MRICTDNCSRNTFKANAKLQEAHKTAINIAVHTFIDVVDGDIQNSAMQVLFATSRNVKIGLFPLQGTNFHVFQFTNAQFQVW